MNLGIWVLETPLTEFLQPFCSKVACSALTSVFSRNYTLQ